MLKHWLWYLWENEDGFFGIGMGPSSGELREAGALGNLGTFGTATGESATNTALNFWNAIMSGDPTKISQVLGPQLSAISKQAGQEKKTAAEFGTRSGGTAAAIQTVGDTERARAQDLIANLTGTGAGALGSMGGNLLSLGLAGHEAAFGAQEDIQKQRQQRWGDIFNSIAKSLGFASGLPRMPSWLKGLGGVFQGS